MLAGILMLAAIVCGAVPLVLVIGNLPLFRRASAAIPGSLPAVSVLVPARNEAAGIARLIGNVLSSRGLTLELLVLDDQSTDDTAALVAAAAAVDPRVRLISGRPLPAGWCGKQHAASQLAEAARHDVWIFLDADVSLDRDALARAAGLLDRSGVDLLSGFPLQRTDCLLAWLLLPLIHFVLLGFLPLARSRESSSPALAAGCGQFLLTRRAAYRSSGGHAAIRRSLHDGIKLPRAYRRAGLRTDVFDASDMVSCRMYATSGETFRGLAKNATEGMAAATTILPFTILLAAGQVLPAVLLVVGLTSHWQGWPGWALPAAAVAGVLAWLPRFLITLRFGQSLGSAVAHPLGITAFLLIQWYALLRRVLGLQTSWRGRSLDPQ